VYARILVPLDGSELAEQILAHATAFADRFGATLILARVVASAGQLRVAPAAYAAAAGLPPAAAAHPRAIAEAEQMQAAAYLDQVGAWLRTRIRPVELDLLSGDATAALLAHAAATGADLVALTTHGRGGFGRTLLGSVADQLVEAAPCPILLLRARDARPVDPDRVHYRRVVVPLDGSGRAEQALPHARAVAVAFGADVVLLRAGGDPATGVPHLARIADELAGAGLRASPEHRSGDPVSAIARRAAGPGGLVVMTTRARGGLDRLILRSVADRVVRTVSGPVLLVRAAGR
jgi:nucleotide-binding universal stress UspA family protein